jgi:hypothetical protein
MGRGARGQTDQAGKKQVIHDGPPQVFENKAFPAPPLADSAAIQNSGLVNQEAGIREDEPRIKVKRSASAAA